MAKKFFFKNFKNDLLRDNHKKKIKKILDKILKENDPIIQSLSKNYKNSYTKNQLNKYKKEFNFRVIGMGGSTLGTKSIYDFLKHKVKKIFYFSTILKKGKKKK